jgi:hypothetical protein
MTLLFGIMAPGDTFVQLNFIYALVTLTLQQLNTKGV